MITIVSTIYDRSEFDNFKTNMENNLPDLYEKPDVVCIVHDPDLYLDCRNYLLENELVGDRLTVLGNSETDLNGLITEKNKYTFILKNNRLLGQGVIDALLTDYTYHPKAGFITGRGGKEVKMRDIYESSEPVEIPETGVVEIDTANPNAILTRTSVFKEYLQDNGLLEQDYGYYLRRKGYINYLDNNIKYI